MIEGTTWLVVDALWEANKDSFWELGENCYHVTLQEMFDVYAGCAVSEILHLDKLEEADQESLEDDLHQHLETLGYWEGQLDEFLDAEEEIPAVWALMVEADLNVEDGNHRLLAAHLLGLDTYPCNLIESNPEKSALFLDLDETLVRTVRIDNDYSASQLFLGDPPWEIRKTAKHKQQSRRYPAALRAYDAGNPEELVKWARQRDIKLLPDHPYITKLRPGAILFLEAVSEMFDEVNILTTGQREFQTEVIQSLGIGDYFDNIYGWKETQEAQFGPPHGDGPLTTSKHVILVDDNGNFGSEGWNSKMTAIGVLDRMNLPRGPLAERDEQYAKIAEGHFLPIGRWFGRDDDTALGDVLDELRGLV